MPNDCYTRQNLKEAKMCAFKTIGKIQYPRCPQCGKIGSYTSGITLSPLIELINHIYNGHEILNLRPGPVLQYCDKCGTVYFNPANTEVALSGTRNRIAVLSGFWFMLFAIITGYILYLYFSGFLNCLTRMQASAGNFQCTVTPNLIIISIFCFLGLVSLIYYGAKYSDDCKKEFAESARRLSNTEYLKAMERFGITLPVKYKKLINSRDNAKQGIFFIDNSQRQDDVYLIDNYCCSYCGYMLKRPSLYEKSIGPALIKCPQCHINLYDNNAIELAAPVKAWQSYRYKCFRKSQLICILLFSGLSFISVAIMISVGYFLKNELQEIMYAEELFGPDAPNIKLFGCELMIEIIAGIGLYKFLLAIFRLHRKGSFMKNFDTLFSESEHRMKNHIYAEKVARGEKLFEEWEKSQKLKH